MNRNQERLSDLKARVGRGEYVVDPHRVADAMVNRLRFLAATRAERVEATARAEARGLADHPMWSYPRRPGGPSANTAAASPGTTRPTQLRGSGGSTSASSRSAAARAQAGRHRHSS